MAQLFAMKYTVLRLLKTFPRPKIINIVKIVNKLEKNYVYKLQSIYGSHAVKHVKLLMQVS